MESSTKVNTQQSHYTVLKVMRKRQIQRSSQTKINKNLRKRVGEVKYMDTRVILLSNLTLNCIGLEYSILEWTLDIKSVLGTIRNTLCIGIQV